MLFRTSPHLAHAPLIVVVTVPLVIAAASFLVDRLWTASDQTDSETVKPKTEEHNESSQKPDKTSAECGGSGWTDVQLVHPADSSFSYGSGQTKKSQETQTSGEDETSIIAALQNRIEELSIENETLSQSVASLNRAAADLEAQVAVSQDENANLSTGLEELDIQHQRAIESVLVTRDETQKEYDNLKVKYAELEDELKMVKEKKSESEQSWEKELMRALDERDSEVECLESENSALRSTIRDLMKQREENVKDTLATIREQDGEELEDLEKQIEQIKKDLEKALNTNKEKDRELAVINQRLNELTLANDALKTLEKTLEQKSMEEKSDKESIKAMEKQITELEAQLVILKNVRSESETLIEHLESQLEPLNKPSAFTTEGDSTENKEINLKHLQLEQENQTLHSKMGQLESRLLELSDQKDHLIKECESKDRKMCQILLESNAAEQECKNELEQQQIKYNLLLDEFNSFKAEIEKKLKERDSEINKLNCRIEADSEIIVSSAVNPELNEKLVLLEQENETIMSESAKIKLENEELILKVQYLNEQVDKANKDLSASTNDYQTLKKQYDFEVRTLESRLNELSQESHQYHIDKDVFVQKEIELKNQLKLKEEEIALLKSSRQTFEDNYKAKITSLENEYKDKLLEKDENVNTINDLQNELDLLKQNMEEKVKSYDDTIANKNKEISNTKGILDLTVTEKDNIKLELDALKDEIATLASQKSQFNSEQYEKERENFLRKIESITEQNSQLLSDVIRLNTEHSAMKNQLILAHDEEMKNVTENLSSVKDALKQTSEHLTAECAELTSKLSQVESERDELFKNIQLKHNECIGFQTEVLCLTEAMKTEQAKMEKTVVEKAQLEVKCESLKKFETEVESLNKEKKELSQEVKRLTEQLDDASVLIKEIKRTEAEGQSADDTSSTKNFKCAEGCEKTQEELNKMSWALHNEQVSNKTLQRQLTDVKEKFEKSEVQLRRLQVHLMEVEQNQADEQTEMEQMKVRLEVAEERLRNSSTAFTSANIRANQQVESLTSQVQMLTEAKDKIEAELSNAEDSVLKQQAAVTNLQAVLHQFELDKQRDIKFETERLRQQLKDSHDKCHQLNGEMRKTKDQMGEMKKGLEAATRLSEQLDKKSQVIETLKSEATVLKEKLEKEKAKVNEIHSSVEGKVDRNLVKNLVVGYMQADDRSKVQVLRVLASVLELDTDERRKLSLEPQTSNQQQSLSEAFIKFLEYESQPKPQLILSVPQTPEGSVSRRTSQSSNSSVLLSTETTSTISHSPVIPPYTLRSNHSILKDLLKDSTPAGSSNNS